MLKVAVIIPTRGDRPKFLKHARWLLEQQTLQPDVILCMNDPAEGRVADLTKRYREGYETATSMGMDLTIWWEDDDWYDKGYIQMMVNQWKKAGKPDLMGNERSMYYHIITGQWAEIKHPSHSSAMNMAMKTGLDVPWPADEVIFLDKHIWVRMGHRGKLLSHKMSIGIKHGFGRCGGKGHDPRLGIYKEKDANLSQLETLVDKKSIRLYRAIRQLAEVSPT